MECIYCRNDMADTEKLEHIIPNALCGMLTSRDICCSSCNSFLGDTIDKPFCAIFSPLLKSTYNFQKTNDARKWPGDNNCHDINSLDVNVSAYNQGMAKIALEFAINKKVDFEFLQKGLKVVKNTAQETEIVEYLYPIIRFYPMNMFDDYIETKALFCLNHKLILFSKDNYLYCYIELFSCFQCYVELSNIWESEDIYITYVQEIRRFNSVDHTNYRRLKDIHILLTQYGLLPNCEEKIKDIVKDSSLGIKLDKKLRTNNNDWFSVFEDRDLFSEILNRAGSKKHYNEISLERAIETQIGPSLVDMLFTNGKPSFGTLIKSNAVHFYLNDDDELMPSRYRKYTPDYTNGQQEIYLYPSLIELKIDSHQIHKFQIEKIQRLIEFLESDI